MMLSEFRPVADIDTVVEDLACGGLVDVHHTPCHRGLAGAGLPHQAEDLSSSDLEGNIIHRPDDGVLAQLEHMGKMLYIQQYFRHGLSLQSADPPAALWNPEAKWQHNGYQKF